MRILYLNHNVVGRGTWVRAAHLARELVHAGHDVTVLTTSRGTRTRSREYDWSGVRVVESPDLMVGAARTGWDAWNAMWRTQRVWRERFDLIHGFDCRPVVIVPAMVQQVRTSAPLVLDWADWWGRGGTIRERSGWPVRTLFGPVETWFEEAFRADATANTTINDALRQRCIGLGVPEDRVMALPNGCVSPNPADPAEARTRLGIGSGPLVLHLGVMQKADAAFLFDAFRSLRNTVPQARLVLVGPFAGAPPPDLAAHIVRAGFVAEDTMRAWLTAADIGVIPLRDTIASRGRWPGKISDYLSAGLPIVMPAVGSAADLIAAAGAGRTAAATPEALAEAMADTLRDADARAAMSEAALALAGGDLAWSTIAGRLMAFYDRWLTAAA